MKAQGILGYCPILAVYCLGKQAVRTKTTDVMSGPLIDFFLSSKRKEKLTSI